MLVIFFVVLISIRYDVGTDYFAYYNFFSKQSVNAFDGDFEIGFSFLIYTFQFLGFSAEIIMAVLAGVSLSLCYLGISKYSKYVGFSLLIYFCLYMIPLNFNAIGQGVVVSIYIASLKYILENNALKVLFISVISFLLHSSGGFMLIAYLFLRLKPKKMHLIFIIFISIFLCFFNSEVSSFLVNLSIPFVSGKVQLYSSYFSGDVRLSSFFIRLFIVLFLFIIYERLSDSDKSIYSLYVLSFLFYSLFYYNGLLATRVNLYFKVVDVILLSNFVWYCKPGISRIASALFIFSFSFLVLVSNFKNENVYNYSVLPSLINS
ncbi:EpsG family protein [Pseudoalteromonas maricaloris]